jgi:hypothetical protein
MPSNATDNYIFVEATGYLTDSPPAEDNFAFSLNLIALVGNNNVSTSYTHIVTRNGTEKPMMFISHTDLTSGSYGLG